MLTRLPLPWLPEGAAEIAPGVGLVTGPGGGVVWVHGMAAFAWDAGDEAGRRLAAVLLHPHGQAEAESIRLPEDPHRRPAILRDTQLPIQAPEEVNAQGVFPR